MGRLAGSIAGSATGAQTAMLEHTVPSEGP